MDLTAAEVDESTLKELIAAQLTAARARSYAVLEPLDDDALVRQHSSIMSPLVWDLAHVGNYEELWLLRAVAGVDPLRPEVDDLYDAFKHPRRDRPSLPLLDPAQARDYVDGVRGRVLSVLDEVRIDETNPLVARGFVYAMVVQHEHQHDETMLATLGLMAAPYAPMTQPPPAGRALPADMVLVPAGPFTMGSSGDPWAYDNERPAHQVHVDAFLMDRVPVTCGQYAEFVDGGGYDDPRWWSERGWQWRCAESAVAPLHWERDGDGSWWRRRFAWHEPIPVDEPVMHVSWFEADAYARWSGKRLPTEAEWEKAAAHDPATGTSRRYPWGSAEPTSAHANLDQQHWRPAPVGAYPLGASAYGVEQLLGDVWEWTSSEFSAYPGFRAFPYVEYSEVFHGGDYRVLRGGSWATSPLAARTTFRNWDHPYRRQVFAGFRCARDATS